MEIPNRPAGNKRCGLRRGQEEDPHVGVFKEVLWFQQQER